MILDFHDPEKEAFENIVGKGDCAGFLWECPRARHSRAPVCCLVLVKPRKDMNNASCQRDMTEMLLKAT